MPKSSISEDLSDIPPGKRLKMEKSDEPTTVFSERWKWRISKKSEEEKSFSTNPSKKSNWAEESEKMFNENSTKLKSNYSATTMKKNEQIYKKKGKYDVETDPVVLKRRDKQISYGKNTIAYHTYLKNIPKAQRSEFHPKTPNRNRVYSRKNWDAQIKRWRIALHDYEKYAKDEQIRRQNGEKLKKFEQKSKKPICSNEQITKPTVSKEVLPKTEKSEKKESFSSDDESEEELVFNDSVQISLDWGHTTDC